jgi:hypothetical protein
MRQNDLSKKERQLTDAALALDKRLAELEDERNRRLERMASDAGWLKDGYVGEFKSISARRSAFLSEIYQLRERMLSTRAK